MKKRIRAFFKTLIALIILPSPSVMIVSGPFIEPVIVNHTCTNINQVPQRWIRKAKSEFSIYYAHTSHGSQIISGMEVLMAKSDLYSFNRKGKKGALSFYNQKRWGDLGNPNRTEWYYRTRKLLDRRKKDRNVIMWSWCGQVSHASEKDINIYLDLMSKLEKDYPNIIFICMTGHLDGTGENGNLNIRNNQIREYCRKNNKILFDFADIESYDPNGNYFLDKAADSECNYLDNGVQKNWAEEWCNSHPGECSSCFCAHSHSLSCELKGRAFWWMMAELAGWSSSESDNNGVAINAKTMIK